VFGKFFTKIIKEKTNVADISPVTFNATGTYNPRYGKQKARASGKAQDGSPGNYFDNYYSGSANYNPSYPNYNIEAGSISDAVIWFNYAVSNPSGNFNTSGFTGSYVYGPLYGNTNTYQHASITFPFSLPGSANGTGYATFGVNANMGFTGVEGYGWQAPPGQFLSVSVNQAYTQGTSWIYSNISGYNPSNIIGYNPSGGGSGTNPSNNGSGYTFDGVYFPGGAGMVAQTITDAQVTELPTTPTTVTIPTGGYLTVSFSL
jgi:hypothetical protein